jgi:hypothetical protein
MLVSMYAMLETMDDFPTPPLPLVTAMVLLLPAILLASDSD